ncbi:PREDICTED: adenosine receptor A2a isoform X3 [Chinchilla lanigera]|uniref:adenosine receptor A2a isoform X3 n=1 Tax=Chinchilla lanigera TaxID=34839 RepID=UPI0006963F2B|nr:PREDICTED: adenosine receptor A2a isoform X3 [Chinchilla lanigera]
MDGAYDGHAVGWGTYEAARPCQGRILRSPTGLPASVFPVRRSRVGQRGSRNRLQGAPVSDNTSGARALAAAETARAGARAAGQPGTRSRILGLGLRGSGSAAWPLGAVGSCWDRGVGWRVPRRSDPFFPLPQLRVGGLPGPSPAPRQPRQCAAARRGHVLSRWRRCADPLGSPGPPARPGALDVLCSASDGQLPWTPRLRTFQILHVTPVPSALTTPKLNQAMMQPPETLERAWLQELHLRSRHGLLGVHHGGAGHCRAGHPGQRAGVLGRVDQQQPAERHQLLCGVPGSGRHRSGCARHPLRHHHQHRVLCCLPWLPVLRLLCPGPHAELHLQPPGHRH